MPARIRDSEKWQEITLRENKEESVLRNGKFYGHKAYIHKLYAGWCQVFIIFKQKVYAKLIWELGLEIILAKVVCLLLQSGP
jgi:hypothetical protein